MPTRTLSRCLILLLLFGLALPATALAEELLNDGWQTGQSLSFQGGFVAGEIGAVRLVPTVPGSWPLQNVQLMFGGTLAVESIVLHIWDDSAGTDTPGTELFSDTYQILGADEAMSEIDLSGAGITVSGPIRVGIEFTHSGYPSIARDDDGSINSSRNFIYSSGLWLPSSIYGLTGDWIIRANTATASGFTVGGTVSGLSGSMTLQNNGGDDLVVTSDGPFVFATPLNNSDSYNVTVLSEPAGQSCVVLNGSGTIAGANVTNVSVSCSGSSALLANDGFVDGGSAGFQGGFAAGEMAASRLTTPTPASWSLDAVQLLFGGAVTTETVTLKIWDDNGGADTPGTELYSADYVLLGGDFLQVIDLTGAGLTVDGDFRVGVQFQHSGYPSVARDDDGSITNDRNFIYTGGAWYRSHLLGLTGDWVIRAQVSSNTAPEPFVITSIADFPNDQGRQVRITWPNNAHDAAGDPTPVTGYALFRRIDAGLKAYPPGEWDYLKTVPAFQEATYATIVPTAADSTISGGMAYATFFVRAMTGSPGVYFDSAPDSGYSLDNLAPAAPLNLVFAAGTLSWDESTAADFNYFTVYGADLDDVAAGVVVGQGVAPSLDVTAAPYPFYFVTATDFAGNEGNAAGLQSPSGVDGVLPARVLALNNYPNPFNPATTISYTVPRTGAVSVGVFDTSGRRVARLVEGKVHQGGTYQVRWNGRSQSGTAVASGIYYGRIETNGSVLTRKMTLCK